MRMHEGLVYVCFHGFWSTRKYLQQVGRELLGWHSWNSWDLTRISGDPDPQSNLLLFHPIFGSFWFESSECFILLRRGLWQGLEKAIEASIDLAFLDHGPKKSQRLLEPQVQGTFCWGICFSYLWWEVVCRTLCWSLACMSWLVLSPASIAEPNKVRIIVADSFCRL